MKSELVKILQLSVQDFQKQPFNEPEPVLPLMHLFNPQSEVGDSCYLTLEKSTFNS